MQVAGQSISPKFPRHNCQANAQVRVVSDLRRKSPPKQRKLGWATLRLSDQPVSPQPNTHNRITITKHTIIRTTQESCSQTSLFLGYSRLNLVLTSLPHQRYEIRSFEGRRSFNLPIIMNDVIFATIAADAPRQPLIIRSREMCTATCINYSTSIPDSLLGGWPTQASFAWVGVLVVVAEADRG